MGNGKSAVLRPVEQPSWKGGSQSEGRQGGHDPETKMRSLLDLPEKCGVCKGGMDGKLPYGWIGGGKGVACSKACNQRYYETDFPNRGTLLSGDKPFPPVVSLSDGEE
ncbi:MAG: hypothetical protein QG653_412 [Patescibacteria group bacterium]|nr:hypothetical protein [Patescibacteria group bacterium]